MAYNFKKLSEVESVDEFPEGAKVLIENNGNIHRCAADGLGGGGGYHWIHLDANMETGEVSCDEEITFESLREDIANGMMPVAIMDVTVPTEYGSMSAFAVMPLGTIEDSVSDYDDEHYETHSAVFATLEIGVYLVYEDGQYGWQIGM